MTTKTYGGYVVEQLKILGTVVADLIKEVESRHATDESAKPIGYIWPKELAQRDERMPARVYLNAGNEYTVPVYLHPFVASKEAVTLSDEQDAARYRTLKQRMKSHSICDGVQFETWFDTEDHDLDAAIDNAILAQHDGRKATAPLSDESRDAQRWKFAERNAVLNQPYASGDPVWVFHVRGESLASGVDSAIALQAQRDASEAE